MKRFHLNLSLTAVIVVLLTGVLLPVILSTAVGIVALATGKGTGDIVLGVLVISLAVAAIGGIIGTAVLVGRKQRLARLQADLLANVSHELRTPLSAIRMYAQTLESGKLSDDPERQKECLATILRETEWLDLMIDRVLTWRASSKDWIALEKEAMTVVPAVQDAVARFNRLLSPGEVKLSLELTATQAVLHDRKALGTMVLNLLTNAYKYTYADKQINVTVTDEPGQVAIRVIDNGQGMTAFEAKRVFYPFYRINRRLNSRATGAGLGLSVVRHLVREHGGRVSVESREGKGSTFLISLPAVERPSDEEAAG